MWLGYERLIVLTLGGSCLVLTLKLAILHFNYTGVVGNLQQDTFVMLA